MDENSSYDFGDELTAQLDIANLDIKLFIPMMVVNPKITHSNLKKFLNAETKLAIQAKISKFFAN
jgi:hypothetical protein